MINLFNGEIINYFPYLAIVIMLVLIFEFCITGAWENDNIWLMSLVGTTICMTLCVVGQENIPTQTIIAIMFAMLYSVFITLYSMYFRRRNV